MKLGFVSAILPDLTLDEVVDFASKEGFACVELMCWPVGKAERRYAGVTHVDVATLDKEKAEAIGALLEQTGVEISGLGYYPNPLTPNESESKLYVSHIKKVIAAARMLKVNRMNTFVGRDWTKTVDDNWPRFLKVWKPIIRYAEDQGVKIGIENCPMFFTGDEWPGGKNLATCPAIWDRMFNDIDSKYFGLNFDPSHFVWQEMDYISVLKEFASKLFHIHAKDARLDRDRLNRVGLLATPSQFHTPKLPGLGDVNWGKFLAALGETGYRGPVCIEVEDRVYEGSVELRKAALCQSGRYLQQFMP